MVYQLLIENLRNLKKENIDVTAVRKQIPLILEERVTKYVERGN